MWMAFLNTGVGDTRELGIVESLNVGSATIAHTRAQTAHQLINHLIKRSLVRHTSGDAFRHKFLNVGCAGLEITVFRAVLHCLERTHAAI